MGIYLEYSRDRHAEVRRAGGYSGRAQGPGDAGRRAARTLLEGDVSQYMIGSDNSGSDPMTVQGENFMSAIGDAVGSWTAYPAHSATAFTGTLTVSGSACADTPIEIWINGVQQGSVTLLVQNTRTLENSSKLSVPIPQGLTVIRMSKMRGNMSFCASPSPTHRNELIVA